MSTRREFAAAAGLAIAGARGRLSREANAYCDKAEAEGTIFTGASPVVTKKAPKAIKVTAKHVRAVQTAQDDESDEWNLADRTNPEGSKWRSESGQIVGEATVCSPCGFSLGWHQCANPQAVVSPGIMERVTLV